MPWWAYLLLGLMVAFAAGVSVYAEWIRRKD